MNADYILLLGLYLGSVIVRTGYERLKKTGRVNPKSGRGFVVILMDMCLMWSAWFSLCPLDPSRIALPGIITWTGLGAFILGLALAVGALVQLRGVENIDRLVTTGLFSKLRHPMYAGFILWILGWAAYHGAVVSLVAGCVGIGNILYWRRLEEEHLEERYKKNYRSYRQRTWF